MIYKHFLICGLSFHFVDISFSQFTLHLLSIYSVLDMEDLGMHLPSKGFTAFGGKQICKQYNKQLISPPFFLAFPGVSSGKEPACQCRGHKRCGFDPWVGKIPLEEGTANQHSILVWRIPWTEETRRLWFIGLQRNVTQHTRHPFIYPLCCYSGS